MNLNRVFILGNLTRTPETKALPSGQSVVNFGVATNRFYKDTTGNKKQDTEFHNVVAFGRLADICSRYLTKGSIVFVEGRIRTRSWQNASGVKQFRTEVIAENIQLGPRNSQGPVQEPEAKNEEIPVIEESYTPPAKDEGEIDVKDIPF
ncbi:single-stranded DNA-binding protein [Patescibacteria group bacterium]|nr:single-stranded DNA-binding protein [Patescibacteria group bacterium]